MHKSTSTRNLLVPAVSGPQSDSTPKFRLRPVPVLTAHTLALFTSLGPTDQFSLAAVEKRFNPSSPQV